MPIISKWDIIYRNNGILKLTVVVNVSMNYPRVSQVIRYEIY